MIEIERSESTTITITVISGSESAAEAGPSRAPACLLLPNSHASDHQQSVTLYYAVLQLIIDFRIVAPNGS